MRVDGDKLQPARSELILGGQKSGKSRRAEALAHAWLAQSAGNRATLIATAQPGDVEMRARIAWHKMDRAQRVPGMTTVEEPVHLAQAIQTHSRADTLIVVDCLTLWLTNLLMSVDAPSDTGIAASAVSGACAAGWQGAQSYEQNMPLAQAKQVQSAMLLKAIGQAPGPLVLVGNEIGWGVIPLGAQVRAFVDALGLLNQQVAQVCERVTLMAAGLPLILKGTV